MHWAGARPMRPRSGPARRRRSRCRPTSGAAGAGAPAGPDRRRQRADGRASRRMLKPGQRLVSREGDLWRWDGFAAAAECADRRRAPACRAQPARRDRERGLPGRARRCRSQAADAVEAAQSDLRRGARRRATPHAVARAQREVDARARTCRGRSGRRAQCRAGSRRWQKRIAAHRLQPRRSQRPRGGSRGARCRACRAPPKLERRLAAVAAARSTRSRRASPRPRRGAGARARGRDCRTQRCSAIGSEQRTLARRARRRGRADRDPRSAHARKRRRSAPRSTTRRSSSPSSAAALIGEIENGGSERRAAADRLAEAETALAEADRPRAPRSKRMSDAREEAARAEERLESARARARRRSRTRSAKCSKSSPPAVVGARRDQAPTGALPDVADVESHARAAPARARAARRASICAPRRNCARSRPSTTKLTSERDDLIEAIKRLRQGIQSLNREGARAAARLLRDRQRALQAAVHRRCSAAAPPSCS